MMDLPELLFFDTFSHESNEETNLDLVQFPKPVFIHEIRIIPLGSRVNADFPGGHRLGATMPSSFKVEFFVNDLSRRKASTFEHLGTYEYRQNVDIQFVTQKVPTDGLVLRGLYTAITLAVYGVLTGPDPQAEATPPSLCRASSSSCVSHERAASISVHMSRRYPAPTNRYSPEYHYHSPYYFDPYDHSGGGQQHASGGASNEPVVVPLEWTPQPGEHSQPPVDVRMLQPQPSSVYHHHTQHYVNNTGQPATPTGAPALISPTGQLHHPDVVFAGQNQNSQHGVIQSFSGQQQQQQYGSPQIIPTSAVATNGAASNNAHHHHHHKQQQQQQQQTHSWQQQQQQQSSSHSYDSNGGSWSRESRDHHGAAREQRGYTPPPLPQNNRGNYSSLPHRKRPHTPPMDDLPPTGPKTPQEVEAPQLDVSLDEELFENMSDGGLASPPMQDSPPYVPQRQPSSHRGANKAGITDDLEEISSDEEPLVAAADDEKAGLDEGAGSDRDDQSEIAVDDDVNYQFVFDAAAYKVQPMQHFSDPGLTSIEGQLLSRRFRPVFEDETVQENLAKIEQIVDNDEFMAPPYGEKWVEVVEMVYAILEQRSQQTLAAIVASPSRSRILHTLMHWLTIGLSFDRAFQQPQPAYKVRHLKVAIKLATCLFLTNESIAQMLLSRDVPRQILTLYLSPFMSLPIKLRLIRCLDAVAYFEHGWRYLTSKLISLPICKDGGLDRNAPERLPVPKMELMTCYQCIHRLILQKQSTRAVVAMVGLVRKIELRYTLRTLADSVKRFSKGDANEDVIRKISAILADIVNIYNAAKVLLVQPLRHLPSRRRFQYPDAPFDPYSALFRIFAEGHLLESLYVLLAANVEFEAIGEIFGVFERSLNGYLFLMSDVELINAILSVLREAPQPYRDYGAGLSQRLFLLSQLDTISSLFEGSTSQCTAAIRLADPSANHELELDNPAQVQCLHRLCSLDFSNDGKDALVKVLSLDSVLERCLMPFFAGVNDESTSSSSERKRLARSVSFVYVSSLITRVVSDSERVSYLTPTIVRILYNLSQDDLFASRLGSISGYLQPLEQLTAAYKSDESIKALLECWPKKTVFEASGAVTCLSTELITTIRTLAEWTLIDSYGVNEIGESLEELRSKYLVAFLFSNDALSTFISILQQICDEFSRSAVSRFVTLTVAKQRHRLISVVGPILRMIRAMLSYLIRCRAAEFKDLSAVPVLIRTYALVHSMPEFAAEVDGSGAISRQLCDLVVRCLLTYTQQPTGATDSDEVLSRSVWTLMIRDVVREASVQPCNFIAHLTLLSQLLPFPFPLAMTSLDIDDDVTREELCTRAVTARKLWSVHFHGLHSELTELISSAGVSSSTAVRNLLHTVCLQWFDLSLPSATVVAESLIQVLGAYAGIGVGADDESKMAAPAVVESGAEHKAAILTSPVAALQLGNLCVLTALLLKNGAFKAVWIHLWRSGGRCSDVINALLSLLSAPTPIDSSRDYALRSIIRCIDVLIDSNVRMELETVQEDDVDFTGEQRKLANALPPLEQLVQLSSQLWHYVGNDQHSKLSGRVEGLRVLLKLATTDSGLYAIRCSLEREPQFLLSWLHQLVRAVNKLGGRKYSSATMPCLEATLELMLDKLLLAGKCAAMKPSLLATLLGWKNVESVSSHPLLELQRVIMDRLADDENGDDSESGSVASKLVPKESLEKASRRLSLIIERLNESLGFNGEVAADKEIMSSEAPVLPPCEPIAQLFARRIIFKRITAEEEVSADLVVRIGSDVTKPEVVCVPVSNFWDMISAKCVIDEEGDDVKKVEVNLISLMSKCLPDFNVVTELERMLQWEDRPHSERRKTPPKRRTTSNNPPTELKRPFVAPIRNVRVGGPMGGSGRANDPFRSRPPNTSRPPSMHVDDFVCMQDTSSNVVNMTLPASSNMASACAGSGGGGTGSNASMMMMSSSSVSGGMMTSHSSGMGKQQQQQRGMPLSSSMNEGGRRGISRMIPGMGAQGRYHSRGYSPPQGSMDSRMMSGPGPKPGYSSSHSGTHWSQSEAKAAMQAQQQHHHMGGISDLVRHHSSRTQR